MYGDMLLPLDCTHACNRQNRAAVGKRKYGTFGPHGDDDVDSERLIIPDGATHPQRNLQRYQFAADVGVFAVLPLSTAAQEVLHSHDAQLVRSVYSPKAVGN